MKNFKVNFDKSQLDEHSKKIKEQQAGADPGFLERWFICIKVWGFALLILSHFS